MPLLFFAVSLLAASPEASAAAPAPAPAKEKMICRDDPETGSLIPKRICHTKAQWQEIYKAGQQNVDTIRNRPMQGIQKGS